MPAPAMSKGRLEAFSDGVFAIIITIMVLELRPPHSAEPEALLEIAPEFLSYVLSFVYLAIYWNNHHHMFQAVRRVDGSVLWANNALLFVLSLVPFATAWMGENHFAAAPVGIYGVPLALAGLAYYVLSRRLIAVDGRDSQLGRAVGMDWKGVGSLVFYLVAIGLSFVWPVASELIYVGVALMWLVPDRRIERQLAHPSADGDD